MDSLVEIYNLYSGLQGVSRVFLAVAAIIVISFSFIQCFLGYRFFKYIVAVVGFFTLFIMGAIFGAATDANITIYGFLFGIAGAFIAFKLYLAGVFLMCASAGMIVGFVVFNSIPEAGIMSILTGVIGVIFTKPFIIASTAVSGGFTAGNGIAVFLELDTSAGLLLGAILAVAGSIYQFMNVRKPMENTNALHTEGESNLSIYENNFKGEDTFESASNSAAATVNAATKSAAVVLDVTGSTFSGVIHKAKQKIKTEANIVFKNARGATYKQVCDDLKELLYNNIICRAVMPFSEIIAGALAAIYVISTVGSFNSLMPSLALIYIFCAMSAINGKLLPALISLTAAESANLYRFIKSLHNINLSSVFYISINILEIVIAFFCVYGLYHLYSNYHDASDKSVVNPELPHSIDSAVFCKDCGCLYSGIDNYCGICGKPLTPATLICHKCGSQNSAFDKFCGFCGEKACT